MILKPSVQEYFDVSTGVMPPNSVDINVSYAYARSKEWYVIVIIISLRHVNETRPVVKPGNNDQSACDSTPRHNYFGECD